ncbi:type II secretion system F family protein [Melghirimyces profundicolus]|uniref:type II secretion system F family protein n=1 Tax=Melghirimyces profundicolus TaxID=1242148 RepID=UPI001472D55B|nr:type II secretion system F family protein [Melghirimyces profundicolus]
MTSLIFLITIAFCFSVFMLSASYVAYRNKEQEIKQHLGQDTINQVKKPRSRDLGFLVKWSEKFASVGENIQLLSEPMELEDNLIKAGYPYNLSVRDIQGAKILFSLIGLSVAFPYYILGLPLGAFLLISLAAAGYFLPIFGIKYLAKKRQEEIQYELPDFMDMMSITLQAGMPLDEALKYYVETSQGPLSEEISRLNQEISFGVQREVAYRSLLKRTSSPELEGLIQSLIQSHNLGTPVSETFAQQAEEMRRLRAEQAKEAAGKAGPKITVVSSIIIAPSIILLIVGVIILQYVFNDNSPFGLN